MLTDSKLKYFDTFEDHAERKVPKLYAALHVLLSAVVPHCNSKRVAPLRCYSVGSTTVCCARSSNVFTPPPAVS